MEHSVAGESSTVDRGEEGRNKAQKVEALQRISQVVYLCKDMELQAGSQCTGGLVTAVQSRDGYQYAARRRDVVVLMRTVHNRVGKLDWERHKNSFGVVPALPWGAG
jgi:hypothetical protein